MTLQDLRGSCGSAKGVLLHGLKGPVVKTSLFYSVGGAGMGSYCGVYGC